MYKESDIIHETGGYWVLREMFKGRTVFKVLRSGCTHSELVATFDLGASGRSRAVADCERRAAVAVHEEILAGLAKERAHSRIRTASGQRVQWTYDGNGGMVRHTEERINDEIHA